MKETPERSRWRRTGRGAALLLAWLIAINMSIALSGVDDYWLIFAEVGDRLRTSAWVIPLALIVVATILNISWVRRRWPDLDRQSKYIITSVVALYLLTAAFGLVPSLLALAGAGIGVLLVAWVVVLPRRLVPPVQGRTVKRLKDRDRMELHYARVKLQNDLRATALQSVAGLAVLAGAVVAFQQLASSSQQATQVQELTRQGQASERFTRAVDQLGSDQIEVRIGGVYGLDQLARQIPDNRIPVTNVLMAFLHRRNPRTNSSTVEPREVLAARAPEIQVAVTALVRRDHIVVDPAPLSLDHLDLQGADFSGLMVGAGLNGGQFSLKQGSVENADFRGTDLRRATFKWIMLNAADFRGADLRGADFSEAGPVLGGAIRVEPADIGDADFRGALTDASTKWPKDFDWRAEGLITP